MGTALSRIGMAAVIAAGLLSAVPAPVAAADGFTKTGSTTYVLDPVKGQLQVTASVTVKNTQPSTTSPYTCTKYYWDYWYGYVPYMSTCYTTTSWYLSSTMVWVEADAVSIKAKSGSTALTAKVGKVDSGYRAVTVSFPKLFYGKTRTVTVTYLRKGGAPRSSTSLRLTQAYASFCTATNGKESGSITVKVPAAFTFDTTGDTLSSTITGGQRVYTKSGITDPLSYYTCFDGANEDGYLDEALTGPSGLTINLRSWPEDPAWTLAIRKDITAGLPALTSLIGKPLDAITALTVEESATGNEYAGFYDRKTNTVTVGEHFEQSALTEHELAHAWFNEATFIGTWINEGYAEWAGRATSHDMTACTAPSGASASSVNLTDWKWLNPRSTDEERAAVDALYDTACYVVTAVADAAGPEGTRLALTALLAGRDPYAADPSAKRATTVANWKDWLDAWDELGLSGATGATGASATLASDLLVQYGVTSDKATLAQRATARTAYNALIDEVGDWVVPVAVRKPMAKWDFTTAQAAMAAAGPAWDLTGQTDAALAGVDARHGPAAKAWAAATTEADLKAAATLSQGQLDAAKDVADAGALLVKPLDFAQQVGLMGSTIPSLDAAVAAVRSGDTAKAKEAADTTRTFLNGLAGVGQGRITAAIVGVVVLLVLLLIVVVVVMRRRRASTRAALAAAASSAAAASASAAWAPPSGPDAWGPPPGPDPWGPPPAPPAPPSDQTG